MAEPNGIAAGRTRPNYLYSIISVALVLFVLGFFALMVLNARQLVQGLKEKVNLIVELKEGTGEAEASQLQEQLAVSSYSKAGSVTYISKEQAAEIMREEFGEDFLKLDLPNPLYDVITFNVKAIYMDPDSLKKVRESLMEQPAVSDVYYQESLVNEISDNIRSLSLIGLGILIFSIIVAGTLIHNTVRLALYANRFLIKNMELVGASWEFISRPYIRRGAWQGGLSGLLASVALMLLYFWMEKAVPGLQGGQHWGGLLSLALLLCVLGIAINTFSTYYVVRKYLKMRVDDLY
ncbi:MAG: ABC transporter permease [Lewinellaceae bacterium]|nr:ABC transporter permease [Lewinellaceae bacterium]